MARTEEMRIKERERYHADPEKYRKKARDYASRNREARAAYTEEYRKKNAEKVAAYKKANRYKYKDYAKAHRKRNSDKYKISYANSNLKKYGLTLADKNKMIQDQQSKCAICENEFKNKRDTHVDHCHSTGKIRGLLCSSCNLILGHAKDSQIVLMSAIKYLKKDSVVLVTEYLKNFDFALNGASD